MKKIGSVLGARVHFGAVFIRGDVLHVTILADGSSVRRDSDDWSRIRDELARNAENGKWWDEVPAHPGDALLMKVLPRVEVDGAPLNLTEFNSLTIAGIDPPWEAEWTFKLPKRLPNHDATVEITVPAIDPTLTVFRGALSEVGTAQS